MTPEVIVHHPIPDDLEELLGNLGFVPVLKTASYTRFNRTTSSGNEPTRVMQNEVERLTPRNQVLVTAEQAAQLLGVGRTTVYKLINEGDLRSVTIGRCRRISARDLESFVEALGRQPSREVG